MADADLALMRSRRDYNPLERERIMALLKGITELNMSIGTDLKEIIAVSIASPLGYRAACSLANNTVVLWKDAYELACVRAPTTIMVNRHFECEIHEYEGKHNIHCFGGTREFYITTEIERWTDETQHTSIDAHSPTFEYSVWDAPRDKTDCLAHVCVALLIMHGSFRGDSLPFESDDRRLTLGERLIQTGKYNTFMMSAGGIEFQYGRALCNITFRPNGLFSLSVGNTIFTVPHAYPWVSTQTQTINEYIVDKAVSALCPQWTEALDAVWCDPCVSEPHTLCENAEHALYNIGNQYALEVNSAGVTFVYSGIEGGDNVSYDMYLEPDVDHFNSVFKRVYSVLEASNGNADLPGTFPSFDPPLSP